MKMMGGNDGDEDGRVETEFPEEFAGRRMRPREFSTITPKKAVFNPVKKWSKDGEFDIVFRNRTRERRLSEHFHNDLESVEAKVNFFRRQIFPQVYKTLSEDIKSMLKSHYDELMTLRNKLKVKNQRRESKKLQFKGMIREKGLGPWEILWKTQAKEIKQESPYGHFPSYNLRPIIVKGGDDLRQEIIAMQLIKKCQKIFKEENTSLYLRTYEIVVTTSSSGIIGNTHF
jgi:hypothetical protein